MRRVEGVKGEGKNVEQYQILSFGCGSDIIYILVSKNVEQYQILSFELYHTIFELYHISHLSYIIPDTLT